MLYREAPRRMKAIRAALDDLGDDVDEITIAYEGPSRSVRVSLVVQARKKHARKVGKEHWFGHDIEFLVTDELVTDHVRDVLARGVREIADYLRR